MLQEPMMEKLTAMRLLGMLDALKAQEQDPASRELSFLERLGLLVDHQWNWRENQALARRLYVAKLKGGACVAHRSLPLQERRIDSEELTRPASIAAVVAAAVVHATTRQHPRFGILRVRTPCCKNR